MSREKIIKSFKPLWAELFKCPASRLCMAYGYINMVMTVRMMSYNLNIFDVPYLQR